jgi:L-alanine-DL-glutamate epimerase-like enolase superfamily enzyme
MKFSRREFIAASALTAGAAALPFSTISPKTILSGAQMKFSFRPYTLELKHVFTIATNSRTTTPDMLTEIEYEGIIGYGEASMPPYLGESQESAAAFFKQVNLEQFDNPFELEKILSYVDGIAPKNPAAKTAIDIALHDLVGKLMNQPWYKMWGFEKSKTPYTTFTIGIDKPDVVRQKVKEAEEFKILKVKLGRDTDKEMIETIRSVTDKPLTADANQGWKTKEAALEMLNWIAERGVVVCEQPMAKENLDDHAWLTERSPIPVIADEACQRLADIPKIHNAYSGINIKLMKATGMREAYKMLLLARALGMKVMLGCMTETSCGISAASHLSPMVDWADLDGALLIGNDCFDGTKVIDGRVTLNDRPGIGVVKL